MAYEYSMPVDQRSAQRIMMLMMAGIIGTSMLLGLLSGKLIAVLSLVFGAVMIVGFIWMMTEQTWYVRVTHDEVVVRRMLGGVVCQEHDIRGVEAGVPCGQFMVQTRIHLKGKRRFVAITEKWRKPMVVRDSESGGGRELGSLLVEWFGACRRESEGEIKAGAPILHNAESAAEASRVQCIHDGRVEGTHSLSRHSSTIDYLYSWSAFGLIYQCVWLVLTIAGGVAVWACSEYVESPVAKLIVLVLYLMVFVILFRDFPWHRLQFRVKHDEVQVRTILGWKVLPRADILGVERGVPVGRELSLTIVHLKNRRQSFSFSERWRKPTMTRHVETGEEIELTPLLVELFGTHTPERRRDVSSTGQRS